MAGFHSGKQFLHKKQVFASQAMSFFSLMLFFMSRICVFVQL